MSRTIDTLTADRNPHIYFNKTEVAGLCGTLKEMHKILDVMRWMAIPILAMNSVTLGIVLAILLQR